MGLWNISQCVSYNVEENASSGKSLLYQRIYGDGSGRRTWDGRAVDLNLSAENQI